MFSNCFDVLMSKIIFKNKYIYYLMYFRVKNIFKNNHYRTFKHLIISSASINNFKLLPLFQRIYINKMKFTLAYC
jgi:hypothetical protein